jgi:predicted nucleic acid-binding protein
VSVYLDSSAVVKLVQREKESTALRRYLSRRPDAPRVTSGLARVEVVRAVSPGGVRAVSRARQVLDLLHEVPLDRRVLDSAASLALPAALRSIDAIQLASALVLGSTLESVVTYDTRMTAAAEGLGLKVIAPA